VRILAALLALVAFFIVTAGPRYIGGRAIATATATPSVAR
jgi:hypothetical protein